MHTGKWVLRVSALLSIVMLYGCGGGGGDGGTDSPPPAAPAATELVWDEGNWGEVNWD